MVGPGFGPAVDGGGGDLEVDSEDYQSTSMAIKNLRSHLDRAMKELGYYEENKKLRVEMDRARKQNEELQAKHECHLKNIVEILENQIDSKRKELLQLEGLYIPMKFQLTQLEEYKRTSDKSCDGGTVSVQFHSSLNMARIEQLEADDKQKKEKAAALNKIPQSEYDGEPVDFKKHLEELTAKLEEGIGEIENLETLNRTLMVKHRMANDELQDARKELIEGMVELLGSRSNIGIKMMGELDGRPFLESCNQRYKVDPDLKAAALQAKWQDYVRDPKWHPFRIVTTGSKCKQIIDERDQKLVSLKEQLGEQVYQAVTTALLEISEYNASGSFKVPELWNYKENRKASISEAIRHVLKHCRAQKRGR